MTTPNHEGTVLLRHGERDVPLRFTFAVFHGMQQEHGLDGWMQEVARGLDDLDLAAMARLMQLTTGVTEAEARELCVPVLPAKQALLKAWQAGMTGNVPEGDDDDAGKTMPQPTLWAMLSKLRFGQGFSGGTSGASPRTPSEPSSGRTMSTGTP